MPHHCFDLLHAPFYTSLNINKSLKSINKLPTHAKIYQPQGLHALLNIKTTF